MAPLAQQGARRQPRRDRPPRLRRLPPARASTRSPVHSDPDAAAPFVAEADEAVPLGGTTAAETYLDIDAILDAAGRTGADAVHPGYGFLAENAGVRAARSREAGLVWIGPPPEAIEAMGSKVRARALMEAAGVPIVPGRELVDGDDRRRGGRRGRLPAAGQGLGGRRRQGDAPGRAGPRSSTTAIAGARREAEAAFGDRPVFLERYLQRPRHVEIQVLADTHGTHGQPRRARVLGPAPPPEGHRGGAVGRRRRRAARARSARPPSPPPRRSATSAPARSSSCSTTARRSREFFFLEMNTRLQVEHPVTEMVPGIDLVAEQLRIAAGEAMSRPRRRPAIDGHAIEVRLYAEDAAAGFLPQTGTVERILVPGAEPFARPRRVAAGRAAARLRRRGRHRRRPRLRPDARQADRLGARPRDGGGRSLAKALAGAELDGLVTNRDFLVRLLRSEPFVAGATDTGLLDREPGFSAPLVDAPADPGYVAAAALAAMAERREGAPVLGFAPPGFRNNFSEPQRVSFETAAGDELEVAYALRRGGLEIAVAGNGARGAADPRRSAPGAVDLEVAGVRRRYRVRRSRRRPPRQRPRRPARPARAAALPRRRGGARRGSSDRADAGQGDQARRRGGRRRSGPATS